MWILYRWDTDYRTQRANVSVYLKYLVPVVSTQHRSLFFKSIKVHEEQIPSDAELISHKN